MEVINLRKKDKIREQASEWIVRLENPDIRGDAIEELVAWLESNPDHRTEFLELISIWGNMDVLSNLAEIIPLESREARHAQKSNKADFRWRPAFVAVASVCIAVLLGVFALKHELGSGPSDELVNRIYSTPVGGQRSIDLPDGSHVRLNTDSSITIDYSKAYRTMNLTRGEAYFDVARDTTRPFVVQVGTGSVTAVGTAFNIKYERDVVGVTVTGGVVEVSTSLTGNAMSTPFPEQPAANKTLTKTFISAGQTVEFDKKAIRSVDATEPQEVDQKLAWQRGMLIFDGDYLEDVVREVSRYTNTKIVIHDEAIRRTQIGGYFRTGEIEAMLKAFEASFGIEVKRVDDDLVVLSKRQDSAIQ